MSDALGALRERVKLQSPLRVADEIGGAAIAWVDEGDVWAEVEPRSAFEQVANDASFSAADINVVIRRRHDVRHPWRLVWSGRILRVLGRADHGRAHIILFCREETL